MPSITRDIFSSSEEFKVYLKTYRLIPGFVLVGWYIEIPNPKSNLPNSRNSRHGTATEAIQSPEHSRQRVISGDHGILFLSGILRSEKHSEEDMHRRDRYIISEEVGTVRRDQIVDFREAFERLSIDENVEQDCGTYIRRVTSDPVYAKCLKWKVPQWQASGRPPSDSSRRKRTGHTRSSRSPRRHRGSYKKCDEVSLVKQEKPLSAAPRSHKSTQQDAPQVPVQQGHPIMPLTEENLSTVSGMFSSQAGSPTHRSRREVEAAPNRKPRSKVGNVITLHGAESDPGVESEYSSPRYHKRSMSSDSYTSSDSGTSSSTTSTTSSSSSSSSSSSLSSRSFYKNSRYNPKNTLNLDIAGREVNIRFGLGQTHTPPDSDNKTIYNIKVRRGKNRS